MSYAEVADKFRGSAEFAKWPAAKTESIVAYVRTLENATDIRQLAALLSR